MRNELEQIARIESYILRSMNAEDLLAFENELKTDLQLRTDLRHQQDILSGMQRLTLRAEIAKAHSYYLFKKWVWVASAILLLVAIGFGVYAGLNYQKEDGPSEISIPVIVTPDHQEIDHDEEKPIPDTTDSILPDPIRNDVEESMHLFNNIKPKSVKENRYKMVIKNEQTGEVTTTDITWDGSVSVEERSNNFPNQSDATQPYYIADADILLKPQVFIVNLNKPVMIETAEGMLVAMDPGCFKDENGKVVTDSIELTIREAFDISDMLKSGLSTMNGPLPIETDGMFSITACADSKDLFIDPKKPLYISTPSRGLKYDLQLWKGETLKDGTINWYAPQDIEQLLTPIDIGLLDFYPPGFISEMAQLGYDVSNKTLTDSLYLSFESLSGFPYKNDQGTEEPSEIIETDEYLGSDEIDNPTTNSNTNAPQISFSTDSYTNTWEYSAEQNDGRQQNDLQGIPPSKVLACTQKKLNNTNIATRAFEERMPLIHQTRNPAILDLYLTNLDKPLHVSDELAVTMADCYELGIKFRSFALRREGRVPIEKGALEMLMTGIREKENEFHTSAIKAIEAQEKKMQALFDRRDALSKSEEERINIQAREELSLTTSVIYKELGYNYNTASMFRNRGGAIASVPIAKSVTGIFSRNMASSLAAPARNTFAISSTGWHNIDRLSNEVIFAKQPINLQNGGKKSELRFFDLRVSVDNASYYDRTYVYLVPKGGKSFIRLENSAGNNFSTKLNNKLEYDLVVIAYKGNMIFADRKEKIIPGKIVFDELLPRYDNELRSMLDDYYDVLNDDTNTQLEFASINDAIYLEQKNNPLTSKKKKDLVPVVFPDPCPKETGKNQRKKFVVPPVSDDMKL